MVALTEKVVNMRTRQDRVEDVRHLNLWGQELTDVSILERMHSVEVMALPVNKLTTLRDFQNCKRLRELYLRKNEVSNVEEVLFLQQLKDLRVLSLEENPCTASANYRARVLQILPHLEKLDATAVTEKEVRNAELLLQITGSSADSTPDPSYLPSPSKPAARPPTAPTSGGTPTVDPYARPYASWDVTPVRPSNMESYRDADLKRSSSTYSPDQWKTPPQQWRHAYDNEVPSAPVGSNSTRTEVPSPYTPPHAIKPSTTSRDLEPVPPNRNQPQSQPQGSSPGGPRSSSRGSSPGVLYAIITLLGELDVDGLKVVKGDVEQRLSQFQH
ncbi:hypothetical protein BSKO_03328 [Bryopsis sp. KO-2023]|nr:hypothetical protein BSKO_03328 [Bryopsis sp. KO-2023]